MSASDSLETRNHEPGTKPSGPPLPVQSYALNAFRQISSRRRTLLGVLIASLGLNLLGLVAPRVTQAILDGFGEGVDLARISTLLLVLTGATTVQILLTLGRRLALVRMSLDVDRDLLGELLNRLLSLPAAFFRAGRAGDLVARFTDHGHVRHLLAGGLTRAAIDSVMVLVYCAVMVAYSVPLAGLVITVLAVFAAFTLWAGPIMRRQHRTAMEEKGAMDAHMTEALTSVDLVKAMGLEAFVARHWQAVLIRCQRSNFQTQRLRQFLESGGTAIQFLTTAGVLGLGAILVMRGSLTTGQLVAFSMYAGQAAGPLVSLVTLWEEVEQARGALARIKEIWEHPPEPRPSEHEAKLPSPFAGRVQFEDVWFSYSGNDGPFVLRGVSFEIGAGQKVALVGASGSGKTTIARLVMGLYQPTRGRIIIDGIDSRDLDLGAFRRQLGVVLQENLLFSGTVLQNIGLAETPIDPRRVEAAARQAGIHSFIDSLPRGYTTEVGEWGLALSGGQRQRVAIARALYRDPKILVLDEATSSLDRATEEEIWQHLNASLAGRTALVIAHRLPEVAILDNILLLEEGLVVDQGSQEGLLAQKDSGPIL